jgi:hypothetical protein
VSFSFGPFTLDDQTGELLRGADPIHLSPKAFGLLKALVEARPRAVSKAEVHERLWPTQSSSRARFASAPPDLLRGISLSADRAPAGSAPAMSRSASDSPSRYSITR